MITKEETILEIERLKQELKTAEKVLRAIEDSAISKQTGEAVRFYRVRPLMAIKLLLREKGPQTQESLTEQMIAGGLTIGKKRDANKPNNIRLSFEKTLRNGTLQQVGDLIGLPEWGPEIFLSAKKS